MSGLKQIVHKKLKPMSDKRRIFFLCIYYWRGGGGHAVGQLVQALHYKLEGRGFDVTGILH